MKKLLLFFMLLVFSATVYSQKEKIAGTLMLSFEKKDYRLLYPHFLPDSVIMKPLKDTSGKETKVTGEMVLLYSMLLHAQWNGYLKAARKNKIDFRQLVIKEVVFQETSRSEGRLYIHYLVKERHGLLSLDVMVIGEGYYIELLPDEEGAFIERDPAAIETILTKYR